MKANGKTVKMFDFPDYSTTVGKMIRDVLDSKKCVSPAVLHCLLAANRLEIVDDIRNARHDVLVMNRYTQSNMAYGIANGINPKWLENLDDGMPSADVVILLDMPIEESFRRKGVGRDKLESDANFLRRVRLEYLKMADRECWKIVSAVGDASRVHDDIMKIVESV